MRRMANSVEQMNKRLAALESMQGTAHPPLAAAETRTVKIGIRVYRWQYRFNQQE